MSDTPAGWTKHASLVLSLITFLIGLTATVISAYMNNRAHIEDLQQRIGILEQRLDRLTERK